MGSNHRRASANRNVPHGQIVATPGVIATVPNGELLDALERLQTAPDLTSPSVSCEQLRMDAQMGPGRPPPKNVPLGRILATPGVIAAVPNEEMLKALARHQRGDWGDVGVDDWKENEFSYDKALRLLSVYHATNGTKFWVITEADRSATTFLLPEEY